MQNDLHFNQFELSILLNECSELMKLYVYIKRFYNHEMGVSYHPTAFKCKNLINLISHRAFNGHYFERKTRGYVRWLLQRLVELNLIDIQDKNSFIIKNIKNPNENTKFSQPSISVPTSISGIQTLMMNPICQNPVPPCNTHLTTIQQPNNNHPTTNEQPEFCFKNHELRPYEQPNNNQIATKLQPINNQVTTALKNQKEKGFFSPPLDPPSISPQKKNPLLHHQSSPKNSAPWEICAERSPPEAKPAMESLSDVALGYSPAPSDDVFCKFKIFWEHYPASRRTHMERAKAQWISQGCEEMLGAILHDLQHRKWPQDPRYIPMPENYLRERRWLDGSTNNPNVTAQTRSSCCEYDQHFKQPEIYKSLCEDKDLSSFGGMMMCRFHQELVMSKHNRFDKRIRHLVAMQLRALRSNEQPLAPMDNLSEASGAMPIGGFLSSVLKQALRDRL